MSGRRGRKRAMGLAVAGAMALAGCGGPAAEAHSGAATAPAGAEASNAAPAQASPGRAADRPPAPASASSAPSASPNAPTAQPESPTSLAVPVVRLIDAGHAPRRVLRYHIAAGEHETLVAQLETALGMGANASPSAMQRLPTTHMTAHIDTFAPDPGSAVAYHFTIAQMTPESSLPAAQLAPLRSALGSLDGLTGTVAMTARGFATHVTFQMPPHVSPVVAGSVDGIQSSFRQLSSPLPEAAVGVGAQWEVRSEIHASGITIEQRALFHLVSLEGDTGLAHITITQSAPAQPMHSPNLPAGATATLDSMQGTGSGQMRFDLAHITPTSSFDVTTTMHSSVVFGGHTQHAVVHMHTGIHIMPGGG